MSHVSARLLRVVAVAHLSLASFVCGQPEAQPKQENAHKEVLRVPLKSTIMGRVKIDGDVPEMPLIDQARNHPNRACCWDAAPESAKRKQTWQVKDGGVAGVIITLEPPVGKSFGEITFNGTAVLEQQFCQYVPHVLVVRPGESLTVKNSSKVGHYVRYASLRNEGNFRLAPNGIKLTTLKAEKKPFSVESDMHRWMSGYIWPTDNPFATVTNETGHFEIPNVPTGVRLTIKIWHESNPKFVQAATLTTKEGDNSVEIKIKPN